MVTISSTNFTANSTTPVQVTFSDGNPCYIGTDTAGIYFSLDNSDFRDSITLSSGTTTVYVRIGDLSGTIHDGIGWAYLDVDHYEDGGWDITVSGGTVPMYEQLAFSFAPRASAVQYNGTLVNTPTARVGRTMTGTILDHHYTYEIERLVENGAKSIVSGASMATALVHKLVIYEVEYTFDWLHLGWVRPSFTDHISALSSALGYTIVYRGSDFFPKTDMNIMLRKGLGNYRERIIGSFGSILDKLCGWSNDVPNMVINMYIENGVIYLVQRGYENRQASTPTSWAFQPTITHTIRRTQWADSATQQIVPKQIASSDSANTNQPYNGTLTWGTTTLVYTDGYLTSETRGDTTTTYTYTDLNDGKRLTRKESETVDPDTQEVVKTAVTTYTYQETGNDMYLFEESYTATEDGVVSESRLIRNVPIGGGWYGSTTYDTIDGDEVEIASNLVQGAPGQKPSQYLVDASNDAIKPTRGSTGRQMVVALNGVAKARQLYGVADYNTLSAIASGLNQYESKEEITLQGEIIDSQHIYTYDDKIIYKGNTYYIVSNTVNVTYNKIRQSITAVRWIL